MTHVIYNDRLNKDWMFMYIHAIVNGLTACLICMLYVGNGYY